MSSLNAYDRGQAIERQGEEFPGEMTAVNTAAIAYEMRTANLIAFSATCGTFEQREAARREVSERLGYDPEAEAKEPF